MPLLCAAGRPIVRPLLMPRHLTTPWGTSSPTGVGTTAFASGVPAVSLPSKHFQGYGGRRPQRGCQTGRA
jgi:hypothetical protein